VPGVVTANSPATYDAPTQTVGVDQTAITLAQSQVTDLGTTLAAKATITEVSGALRPLDVTDQEYLVPEGLTSAGVIGANNAYYSPLFIRPGTYDRIGLNIAVGESGKVARLGLLNADPATGLPSTVAVDAGQIPLDSTGLILATVSATLPGGFYWGAVVADSSTATATRTQWASFPRRSNLAARGGLILTSQSAQLSAISPSPGVLWANSSAFVYAIYLRRSA
jgi:hypothetical protein